MTIAWSILLVVTVSGACSTLEVGQTTTAGTTAVDHRAEACAVYRATQAEAASTGSGAGLVAGIDDALLHAGRSTDTELASLFGDMLDLRAEIADIQRRSTDSVEPLWNIEDRAQRRIEAEREFQRAGRAVERRCRVDPGGT